MEEKYGGVVVKNRRTQLGVKDQSIYAKRMKMMTLRKYRMKKKLRNLKRLCALHADSMDIVGRYVIKIQILGSLMQLASIMKWNVFQKYHLLRSQIYIPIRLLPT